MSGSKRRAAKKPAPPSSSGDALQRDIQGLVALYRSGKLNRAEVRAKRLIKACPGMLGLYDVLSAAQVGQGKLEDAATSCRRALEVDPEHVGAHSNLGIIFAKLGRLDEAIASCRKALSIDPVHAEARINLGAALRAAGRLEEAVACYREALEAHPGRADAHSNLGNALKDLGHFQEAVASHREAVRLKPDSPEAHNNLGNALTALDRFQEAVASYRQSLKLRPDDGDTLSNLGNALSQLGRLEEAVASYERAIEIAPDLAPALNNLGALYERMNDIGKATDYTLKALDVAPSEPGTILLWSVLLRRKKQYGEAIATLEALAGESLADAMRVSIHGELGKLYDLTKDSKQAFEHFSIANALQARNELSAAADKQAFLDHIRHMDETLTAGWAGSWVAQADGGDYETPAFLVGFPRSGTTLLDQIMNSHPALQVMEEKPAFDAVIARLKKKFGDYPASIATLDSADIAELRELYFRSVGSHLVREPSTLLIDKLPLHIRHIPLIVRLFPKAKTVLALRHPCDVVLSNFMQNYRINEAMANFFTLDDAARCYAEVMGLWQKSARLLPVSYHALKYESLVDDFEGEVRKLLDFLGVGWDDAVREYDRHARARGAINTPSYQAVAEPINSRARYRWKRYEEELAPVMAGLTPFIEAFGYADR